MRHAIEPFIALRQPLVPPLHNTKDGFSIVKGVVPTPGRPYRDKPKFYTPSKEIEFFSQKLAERGHPPMPIYQPAAGRFWEKIARSFMLGMLGLTFAGQALAFFTQLAKGEEFGRFTPPPGDDDQKLSNERALWRLIEAASPVALPPPEDWWQSADLNDARILGRLDRHSGVDVDKAATLPLHHA